MHATDIITTLTGMLAVIVDLLCSLHTQHTDWEKSDTLMRIQLFSYVSSLCAQNQANCRAVLSLPNWEHWLLMLADQQGAAEDGGSALCGYPQPVKYPNCALEF